MITLSDWLSGRASRSLTEPCGDVLEQEPMQSGPASVPSNIDALVREAREAGRLDGLAEGLQQLEDVRSTERRVSEMRERELAAQWASRCSDTVVSTVELAFRDLKEAIERSLLDVLLPFLDECVGRKSLASLLDLLTAEMKHPERTPIEIKAPPELLEPLRKALDASCLTAVLTQSEYVEIVSHGGRVRFEGLAQNWIDELRGLNHE